MDRRRLIDFLLTVILVISFYFGAFSLPVRGAVLPLHMSDHTAALGLPLRAHDYRYTNEALNLRGGPGIEFAVLSVLPSDVRMDVLEVLGSWGRIYYQGQPGYVHLGYTRREKERPKPVASEPVAPKPSEPKPKPSEPAPKPPPGESTVTSTPAKVVSKGLVSMEQRTMAITIDAGWLYEDTMDILNVLDKNGVKATFFLRAYWVRDNPDLARAIKARGHVIGNHSTTHGHMTQMTEEAIRWEFTEAKRIFKDVLGEGTTLFRPPFGEYNDRVLRIAGEEGFRYSVMWSIDTHDWAETLNNRTVDVDYIIRRVLDLRDDRDIVLMHIAYDKTPRALEVLLPKLKSEGVRFVTLKEMLP